MAQSSFALRLALAICFLFSGAASLIYETVWTRQLAYHFAGTSLTSCLVLTAFMGGMAIGSFAAGRAVHRLKSPLSVYAYLELALAVCGAVYPKLIDRVGLAYAGFVRDSGDSLSHPFALKFALFVLLLVVPAIFMGATLPLVVQLAVPTRAETGRGLGLYYAINSAGGVIGCVIAGFVLIEQLGLAATSNIGAAANMIAVLTALGARPWLGAAAAVAVPPAAAPLPELGAGDQDHARVRALAIAVFVSGFCAMAYEVLWARVLPLVLGSSTYSFCLMLTTFVTGVTVGSLGYSRVARRTSDPARIFALAQVGVGLWVLVTVPLYAWLPYPFVFLRTVLGMSFPVYQAAALGLNALVMFIPAVLFGLAFPAAVQAANPPDGRVGRSVGSLYAANTAGNVAGSLATGLVLIPGLGSPLSFQAMALFNLVCGLHMLPTRRVRVAVVFVAIVCVLWPGSRDWMRPLATGNFSRIRTASWREAKVELNRGQEREIVELIEDDAVTVAVSRHGGDISLWVNSKVDASTGSDMGTQALLALYGLLFHPKPERIYVLGLGSGATAGAALASPDVLTVDCAEIATGMVLGSRHFADSVGRPLEDPRFHLIVDDGRHALQTRRGTYDVIVLQPSNPWLAGMTNLFTREFLTTCREKLAPGGLLIQWMVLYEMDQYSISLILRTLARVFPHVRTFQNGADILIVAAADAASLDPLAITRRVGERIRQPGLAALAKRIGMPSPFALFAMEQFETEGLKRFAGPGVLLTDDQPELEFTAPIAYYAGSQVTLPAVDLPHPRAYLTHYLDGRKPTAAELADAGEMWMKIGLPKGVGRFLERHAPGPDARLEEVTARAFFAVDELYPALAHARAARKLSPDDPELAALTLRVAREVEAWDLPVLARRDFPESRDSLRALIRLEPAKAAWRLQLADFALAAGALPEAEAALAPLAKTGPDAGNAAHRLVALARYRAGHGDPAGARATAERALALVPGHDGALDVLDALANPGP